MDINKVIQLGEQIKEQDLGMFSQFTPWIWVWIGALIALSIFLFFTEDFSGKLPMLIAGLIFTFNAFILPSYKEEQLYKSSIEKWKKEVAYTYIQSIQKEQKEIVYIKIDPELSSNTHGFMVLGSGSVQSTSVEKTPVVVSYKDNGVVTRTDWVPTHMELTTKEKPYIEFQRLPKDLGYGIKAGIYHPEVYLPESYSFTEIK